MSYLDELTKQKDLVVEELARRRIEERYLVFGGAGEKPVKQPRPPTDVRSEFLANRAMGDWAENTLCGALRSTYPDLNIAHYGADESISAGEDGFKEFYLAGIDEVRRYGKRPDLLIFDSSVESRGRISDLPFDEREPLGHLALSSIEVRSSKFEALTYIEVRKKEREEGKSTGRRCPSFTVKVEDLKIVYRWIERYKVRQVYCQVFFDAVFAIDVLEIFRIIGSGAEFSIETPEKSQLKSTIMVPVTAGAVIGNFTKMPTFSSTERVTRLGRHDAYVVPKGGSLVIDSAAASSVLLPDKLYC